MKSMPNSKNHVFRRFLRPIPRILLISLPFFLVTDLISKIRKLKKNQPPGTILCMEKNSCNKSHTRRMFFSIYLAHLKIPGLWVGESTDRNLIRVRVRARDMVICLRFWMICLLMGDLPTFWMICFCFWLICPLVGDLPSFLVDLPTLFFTPLLKN